MLCEACAEHFKFAHPRHIVARKKVAIQDAIELHFDQSQIETLQGDLERYRHSLESKNRGSKLPCPWNTSEPLNVPFRVGEGAWSVWHSSAARSWRELKDTAILTECGLCKKLVAMIQCYETVDDAATISSMWFLRKGSHMPTWLRIDVWERGIFKFLLGFHPAVENIHNEPGIKLNTPQGTSTSDKSCIDFLSESLEHCLSQHKSCSVREDNEWLPARLLDVLETFSRHGSVRIVERQEIEATVANMRVKYLTLSHVWGSTNPLSLTKINYSSMKIGIQVDLLPQCFVDAIWIARRLDIPYLWIDSLCIIQDSHEDWEHEAANMDKVYRNGTCNISACDASDSSQSLFLERKPDLGGPLKVVQEFADQTVRFTLIPDWVRMTWHLAPVYRRGWVVQERFLSSRMMHFSKYPFFECRETLSTEMYPKGLEKSIHRFPQRLESQRNWALSSIDAKSSVLLWWDVVKIYTRCILTVESDKLIALSGLVKQFAENIKEHLVSGLLWRIKKGSLPNQLGSEGYRAPSWSWASRDGEVSLDPFRKILRPVAYISSIQCIPKGLNSFGQLIGGELIMKGFLFEVSRAKEVREKLKWSGSFYLDYEFPDVLEDVIYFLPLAELIHERHGKSGNSHNRKFAGIFVQEAKIGKDVGRRELFRVGDCFAMDNGGDGYVLDAISWERLLHLDSAEDSGEKLILI